MVSRKDPERCRLCGDEKPLTFEHVPPRVTFNDHTVIEKDFMSYMGPNGKEWSAPPDARGRQMQRGNGGQWLCRDCNSFLGREYVPHYAKLVRGLASEKPFADGTIEVRSCCLKRFMKQVVAMFVTINAGGPDWRAFSRFARELDQPSLPSG